MITANLQGNNMDNIQGNNRDNIQGNNWDNTLETNITVLFYLQPTVEQG